MSWRALLNPRPGASSIRAEPVAGDGAVRRVGPLRQAIQMIFQDPYSSLNSRIRIGSILAEPILFYRLALDGRGERDVRAMLHRSRWSRSQTRRPVSRTRFPADSASASPSPARSAPRPRAARLRRADLVARRLGAGADPQPPEGPARRDRALDASAHQPRPRGRAPDVRSRRGHEEPASSSSWPTPDTLFAVAAACLHAGIAVARPDARPHPRRDRCRLTERRRFAEWPTSSSPTAS